MNAELRREKRSLSVIRIHEDPKRLVRSIAARAEVMWNRHAIYASATQFKLIGFGRCGLMQSVRDSFKQLDEK